MKNQPLEITAKDEGTRLMRWFLQEYPGMPQREFYRLARGGQIRINSSRVKGKEILYTGDNIRIPPTIEKYKTALTKKTNTGVIFSLADLEKLRKSIIHDDEDIVVFNKPAGIAVQGGSGINKSMDKMVAAMYPYDKISLVHRLDKDTSGVLIIAKNQKAAQRLSNDFHEDIIKKEYLALLAGKVLPRRGTIDNFIQSGRVMDDFDKTLKPKPQRAVTEYKVLTEISGLLSWVLFKPKTGRKHQLRLHSYVTLGAPIVGDSLYNRFENYEGALGAMLVTKNLFLFAHKLSFPHPRTRELMIIKAQPPEFMQSVIKFLELDVPK